MCGQKHSLYSGGETPEGEDRGKRRRPRDWILQRTPEAPRLPFHILSFEGPDPCSRAVLLQRATAVLTDSVLEPFGLAGGETMAAGGTRGEER